MNDIQLLIDELVKFRDDRNWEQFHNTKDLADVFAFSLLLAGKHGFDVMEIVLDKIRKNGEKYSVEKSKGTAEKYNEL